MASPSDDLPSAFENDYLVRKGLCPVTQIRHQAEPLESHSLYFEQHGWGTEYKVIFIMGLNSSGFAWGPQVKHFAPSDSHTILVYDNRGVGNSGYPRGPYTTAGMAEDAIVLLDYIGWTEKRGVHVVGVSLGGMIAQELASRIPERIASLSFIVTTPGGYFWQNLPPWKGVRSLATLMFTPDIAKKTPIVMEMLFTSNWLKEKAKDDSQGRTNFQVQTEEYIRRMSITKPQQFMGHISQMFAAVMHRVTPDRLGAISRSIPKVTIVTGDVDNLVLPYHSHDIKASMPEAEFVQWEDTGHGIHVQRADLLNALLERTFKEGKKRSAAESA
ncbi:alpha/beta-hydrolase [Pleurotus eryngii]|uniref:Alpha/beta-hydrolase n=1 Tax=Pleurotus eryngii TaxID=5323 RepID=A0A9P5ZK49_PLEER|nr:alpha/beta-hydrolase [Pleurotus eryngii]